MIEQSFGEILQRQRMKAQRLESELITLRAELETVKRERDEAKERLQISPQGDDKIDELESAMEYLRAKNERLRGALDKIKGYNEWIMAGRINYRPADHITVAYRALNNCMSECVISSDEEQAQAALTQPESNPPEIPDSSQREQAASQVPEPATERSAK